MPDGGFVTSLFYRPSQGGIDAVFASQITGGILRWTPGGKVTEIPGTQVSGANGIAVSHEGRVIHMAAWGTRELVRFEWNGAKLSKKTVPLSFAGDNLRWSADGKSLLIGGQKFVARKGGPASLDGWSVVRVNPDTLEVKMVRDAGPKETMQGITVGVEVGNDIWVGQFRGNQVGYFPRQ
jgi:sugar lactone lactonase YvrE